MWCIVFIIRCRGIDETQKSEETVANSPFQDTHSETSSFLEVGLCNKD